MGSIILVGTWSLWDDCLCSSACGVTFSQYPPSLLPLPICSGITPNEAFPGLHLKSQSPPHPPTLRLLTALNPALGSELDGAPVYGLNDLWLLSPSP